MQQQQQQQNISISCLSVYASAINLNMPRKKPHFYSETEEVLFIRRLLKVCDFNLVTINVNKAKKATTHTYRGTTRQGEVLFRRDSARIFPLFTFLKDCCRKNEVE